MVFQNNNRDWAWKDWVLVRKNSELSQIYFFATYLTHSIVNKKYLVPLYGGDNQGAPGNTVSLCQ